MDIVMLMLSLIFGLCLGSFVHVAICRFSPHKTALKYLSDITFSRSTCPHCNNRLSYLSLIPVVSWLIQYGRCRYCYGTIPIHYLLTECFISFYCTAIILIYGFSLWPLILLLLGLYFIVLAVIDCQYLLLPNYFIYPLLLSGSLLNYAKISNISFSDGLIGLAFGYALLWLPATLYYIVTKNIGLGGGDIKLLSALGTWIHYSQLPILLVLASIIGIIYIILLSYHGKIALKTGLIPFGPCLLVSAYGMLLMLGITRH